MADSSSGSSETVSPPGPSNDAIIRIGEDRGARVEARREARNHSSRRIH